MAILSPCGSCQTPICDAPVIEVEQVSATKSKCGFPPFSAFDQFSGLTVGPALQLTGSGCDKSYNAIKYTATGTVPGGSRYLSLTLSTSLCSTNPDPSCVGAITTVRSYTLSGAGVCTSNTTTCSGEITCDDFSEGCGTFGPTSFLDNVAYTQTGAVSDEYTNDMLYAAVLAAMPAYGGTYTPSSIAGIDAEAYYHLSPDGSSLTLASVKARLKHYPSGTCYLKVWVRSRFQPETFEGGVYMGTGAPDTLTDIAPYEWTGSPCMPDPTKAYDDPANAISFDLPDLAPPESNGDVVYEIKKYSCVQGYEPPDDGSANGFPA